MANMAYDPFSAPQIDHGEKNDLLIASPNGTQNLQAVTFYFPHPAGVAYDMTITDSNPADDDLWPDDTISTGETPLAGGTNATYTCTTSPTTESLTFLTGATHGSTALDALHFTISGEQNVGESTDGAVAAGASAATQSAPLGGWRIDAYSDPNGITADGTDVTGLTRNWLVGQRVTLKAYWSGANIDKPKNLDWKIGGDILQTILEPASQNYREAFSTLDFDPGYSIGTIPGIPSPPPRPVWRDPTLTFFWMTTADYGENFETDAVTLSSPYSNVPSVSTTFHVFSPSPTATNIAGTAGVATVKDDKGRSAVVMGLIPDAATRKGIQWTANVKTPTEFPSGTGKFDFLQVVKPDIIIFGPPDVFLPDKLRWGLDFKDPYGGREYNTDQVQDTISGDAPRLEIVPGTRLYYNSTFTTSVMYKPPGAASEWVPLEAMAWAFSVESAWRVGGVPNAVPQRTWQVIGGFSRKVEEPHWNGKWIPDPNGTVQLVGRNPVLD